MHTRFQNVCFASTPKSNHLVLVLGQAHLVVRMLQAEGSGRPSMLPTDKSYAIVYKEHHHFWVKWH